MLLQIKYRHEANNRHLAESKNKKLKHQKPGKIKRRWGGVGFRGKSTESSNKEAEGGSSDE